MKIGYDAKRAFHNQTGLGHYSRTLIQSLASLYPEHHYYLFNPKPSGLFQFNNPGIHEINPGGFLHKTFSGIWRSRFITADIKRLNLDIYHGLSHELPFAIEKTKVKSVVTMHDLIHERYPEQYPFIDRKIYSAKFKHACRVADRVIAISQQTKDDLIQLYKTPESNISVCYQSCNESFRKQVSEADKIRIKKLYELPDDFYLYVGSVIERKNLLTICKAIKQLSNEIPLVVIGSGGQYLQQVKTWIRENGITSRVIFLSEHPNAQQASFKTATDFPAIYQQALCLIYPSFYEGFGIPVLEALCSGLPVITSNRSCMPETGGDAARYVNPDNALEMADCIKQVTTNENLRSQMIKKGFEHAGKFTAQKAAEAVMQVYQQL